MVLGSIGMKGDQMDGFMRLDEFLDRDPVCQYCDAKFPTWEDMRGHMCDGVREHRERVDQRRAIHGIAPKKWRD